MRKDGSYRQLAEKVVAGRMISHRGVEEERKIDCISLDRYGFSKPSSRWGSSLRTRMVMED